MNNFQEKTSFIWSVADEVLRDDFKRGEYPDVILPFTVLRRLDCVLAPTKDKVLEYDKKLEGKIENKDGALRHGTNLKNAEDRGTESFFWKGFRNKLIDAECLTFCGKGLRTVGAISSSLISSRKVILTKNTGGFTMETSFL